MLATIYWRKKNFGECKVYDLLGDIGIAHMTLFDHLNALKQFGLVSFSKPARNLSSSDQIDLTSKGEEAIEKLFLKYNINFSQPLPTIFQRISELWQEKIDDLKTIFKIPSSAGVSYRVGGKLSKIMHELFKRNITEPVATSLAMYSDIDQLLYELKKKDKKLFDNVCRGWLNLEIRMGRLASISIPVAIRNSLRLSTLQTLLYSSWLWPKVASGMSFRRYVDEATSLGLISLNKTLGIALSTKPTTSYILEWLAFKTHDNFENVPSPNPKVALLIYKETFNFPTEEEIRNPEISSIELDWLSLAREILGTVDYETIINKTLGLLKEKVGVITEFEGRLIPYGYSRVIEEVQDLKTRLGILLKYAEEGNILSKILLLIHANPGITTKQIMDNLQRDKIILDKYEVENAINSLQGGGLVIAGTQPGDVTVYYSFLHVPYITPYRGSKLDIPEKCIKDLNTVIRTYIVHVLSVVRKTFRDPEQLKGLIKILEKLAKGKTLSVDDLKASFDNKFIYSLVGFITQLEPFINIDYKNWIFKLKEDTESTAFISKLILDLLVYELLTGSEALNMYANILTDVVIRRSFNLQQLLDELKQAIFEDIAD